MITFLLIAISMAIFIQPNLPRFFAAFVFVAHALAHEFFFVDLEGFSYHATAALLEYSAVITLCFFRPAAPIILKLQIILMSMTIVNMLGYVAWALYFSPIVYNSTMEIMFLWALIVLITEDSKNARFGAFPGDSWRPSVYQYWRTLINTNPKNDHTL